MNVLVVSGLWPSYSGNSGVSLSAIYHVKVLIKEGHNVSILGSDVKILNENLNNCNKYYIHAKGSGSLYSPVKINKLKLNALLRHLMPDLIIVESLQTAITDSSILEASKINVPLLLISHGVSVHEFTSGLIDKFRAWAWIYYKLYKLPKLISKLNGMTTLSLNSKSKRFYDRDLAIKMNIPIFQLNNYAINSIQEKREFDEREFDLVHVGYFSRIKNQIGALEILRKLPNNISLIFVGNKSGFYYQKCIRIVNKFNLQNRTLFLADSECSIASIISNCKVLILTSITEAQPIVLLEAISSGTPFVASDVGCISDLKGGLVSSHLGSFVKHIQKLSSEVKYWNKYSDEGFDYYEKYHNKTHVSTSFTNIVNVFERKNKVSSNNII